MLAQGVMATNINMHITGSSHKLHFFYKKNVVAETWFM